MVLDTLLANSVNKAALLRLHAAGKLPHAILLEGARGSGRFTFARGIAALAVCRAKPVGCGVCPDCKMALSGNHPDVEVFAKADAPGTLTINSLRTINQSVATPPVQGERRVVILRDIQDTAQQRTLNTLLKVLEEPPAFLMFILTVDNRENLLPTILSRCLQLRMECPPPEDCAREALRIAGCGTTEEAVRLGMLCDGNIGRTARLLGNTPEAKIMADAWALSQTVTQGEAYEALRLLHGYERDRVGHRVLIAYLQEIFGRAIEGKFTGEAGALSLRLTAAQGIAVLDILDAAGRDSRQNVNLSLALTRLGAMLYAAIR